MTEEERTTILKRDALGRVTITREQREALLDEFERSGLKGQPFARMVGVTYATFADWIQKRRHARGDYAATASGRQHGPKPQQTSRSLRLVEAVRSSPDAQAEVFLELLLPGGVKLRLTSPAQSALAAQLLKALHTSC